MKPDSRDPEDSLVRVRVDVSVRTLVLIPCVIALCFMLLRLVPVLLALIVALMLVGTLNPAVHWLARLHLKRTPAIVVLFLGMFLATVGLAVLTLAPLVAQVQSVVEHEPQLRNKLADALGQSHYTAGLAERLRHVQYGALAESSMPKLLTASTQAVQVVTFIVSVFFLALYIMLDSDRLRGGLFALTPRAYHVRLSRILLNLAEIVGGYIRGQAVTCALMAAFTWTVLMICQVPNALALAMFAGVADLLPYVGALLAVGPAALVAATQGISTVLIVTVTLFAYQELESRFIVPRVYGQALRLPSSVVLFSLLAGGVLMGIPGALLALPTAAALRMVMLASRVALPGDFVEDETLRARDEQAEKEYTERARGANAEEASAIAMDVSEHRLRQEGDLALEAPITSGERVPAHDDS
jgi:putative heme transporter